MGREAHFFPKRFKMRRCRELTAFREDLEAKKSLTSNFHCVKKITFYSI